MYMLGTFVPIQEIKLIDTCNQKRLLEELVYSVLMQDFLADDREIVVVEDGSAFRAARARRRSTMSRYFEGPS